jgi:carbonic anhydrase
MSTQWHACQHFHRRRFLTAGCAAGAAALLAPVAHAAALSQAKREKMTPDDVLAMMRRGNKRFSRGQRKNYDFLAQQRATAAGQYPAAVLLSCIDSRAPAETIMDLRIGDIFNCRVAGNVENGDILGSMEFATKLAGAKVVLVMGHTSCGAIKGAIDNAQLGNLTGLLAKIRPAVEATAYSGERTATNYAFVDAVARKNVEITLADIRKHSPVLAELESRGTIRIAGAMYDLKSGVVEFIAG